MCIQSGQVTDDTARLIPCHLDSGVITQWCDRAVPILLMLACLPIFYKGLMNLGLTVPSVA